MALEVLDTQALAEALVRGLAVSMPDAILVGINCTLDGASAMDNHGLDLAIDRVKERRPLILYSFFSRSQFNLNRKFHYLLGHLNCGFVRLPAELSAIREEYEQIKYRFNPDADDEHVYQDDELCLSLLDLRDTQNDLRVLAHDLHHARTSGRMAQWLIRAQAAGYSGTEEEVVAAIEAKAMPNSYAPLADRFLPGSFVDLEGTLFRNGELDQEALKLARHSRGRLTLWTGGDLEQWAKVCREHHLPWKVMSKWLFRGAKVEYAFDDQPLAELRETYGFDVWSFRQV